MNRRGFMKSVGGALAALGLVREIAPEEPEEIKEVVVKDPIVSPETITVGSGHMVVQYEAEGSLEIGEFVVAGSDSTKVKAADRNSGRFPTKLGTTTYSTTPIKKISVG